jgi:hypothetical protein
MKSTPFVLLLLGALLIWLGMTGRLGAVLAAIFEPTKLVQGDSGYTPPAAAIAIDPYPGGVYF